MECGLSLDVWQYILCCIENPIDLLQMAQINKMFYQLSRCNTVWLHHKNRVLNQLPILLPLFEKYGNAVATDTGKLVVPKLKKHKTTKWIRPKGIWYVFARHLLFKTMGQLLSRNSSKDCILDAICLSSLPTHLPIDIVNRSHPATGQYRFQRCICLRNFTFIWICIPKNKRKINIYKEKTDTCIQINSTDLLCNFKLIITNNKKRSFSYISI